MYVHLNVLHAAFTGCRLWLSHIELRPDLYASITMPTHCLAGRRGRRRCAVGL